MKLKYTLPYTIPFPFLNEILMWKCNGEILESHIEA